MLKNPIRVCSFAKKFFWYNSRYTVPLYVAIVIFWKKVVIEIESL